MSAFLHYLLHPSQFDYCIMRTSANLTARFIWRLLTWQRSDSSCTQPLHCSLQISENGQSRQLHASIQQSSDPLVQHGDGHTAARHSLHATGSRHIEQMAGQVPKTYTIYVCAWASWALEPIQQHHMRVRAEMCLMVRTVASL